MSSFPSIHRRLSDALLVWALAWSVAVSTALWLAAHHEVNELLDDQLQASAEVLAALLGENQGSLVAAAPSGRLGGVPSSEGASGRFAWQVVEPGGRLLLQSSRSPSRPLRRTATVGFGDELDWRVFGAPLGADGRMLYVAQTREERGEAQLEMALSAILSTLAIGLLGHIWLRARVRRELEPLRSLSTWLQEHEPLDAGTRLGPPQRGELAPMHAAIEALSLRLSRRIARERAFSAHVAHALRTPLAGIDAQLAVALREAPESLQARLQRVREAAGRLQRVVAALLGLFRTDAEPRRQAIDLAALLQRLPVHGLGVEMAGPATLDADPDLLSAALLNLLDNAQRHGAGRVTVSLPQPGTLRLHDDGPGIDRERRQALQQALDAQDYEHLPGLGLVLADAVARAHGGVLRLPEVKDGFAVELHLEPPRGRPVG